MLPNLIVIGAMKCGTTSLHKYLDLHPQVYMSEKKELNFFTEGRNWKQGLEWYQSHFPESAQVAGESSTNYSKFPAFPGVPERLHTVIPDAKLVYIVRDPIDRIVSHYLHNVRAGRENRTFAEALKRPEKNHYVNCSRYFTQLQRYLTRYPRSRITVTTLEDLSHQPQPTLERIFRFLDVDPFFWDEGFSEAHNPSPTTRTETTLSSWIQGICGAGLVHRWVPWLVRRRVERPATRGALRESLLAVLGEDVENLRSFTGRPLAEWTV